MTEQIEFVEHRFWIGLLVVWLIGFGIGLAVGLSIA